MKWAVPLSPQQASLWESMPKLDGYVIALPYCPPKQLPAYEKKWGDWCRANLEQRCAWPDWLEQWLNKRKAER